MSDIVPTLPPGYEDMPEQDRWTALAAWATDVELATDKRDEDPDAFVVLGVGGHPLAALLFTRACTSLSDEEATARINSVPSGTRNGWTLCAGEGRAPVACEDKPTTHRHLMWGC